jgi:NAD(P)H-flavin reductase
MTMTALSDPFAPAPCRVLSVRRELEDAATLELAAPGVGQAGFSPGQFNMLYVFGVGESAISISGDSEQKGRFLHTVRAVGKVSSALTHMKPGAAVGFRGPFGSSWPVREAEGCDMLVVGGGLGLAPLRPAIYRLLANRERYGRVVLLYGARSPADILYREELSRWRQRLDVDIHVTVDHASGDWRGAVGVVPDLISRSSFDPEQTISFVCGPEVMMRYAANALTTAGVAADRIWLSIERNMKCAIGLCGHCQFGPRFVCKDGPVMRYDRIAGLITEREI